MKTAILVCYNPWLGIRDIYPPRAGLGSVFLSSGRDDLGQTARSQVQKSSKPFSCTKAA